MLEAARAARALGRRVLRARRLRRGPGADGPARRQGGRAAAAHPRQPARAWARASRWPARSAPRRPTTARSSATADVDALRDAGVVATLLPGGRVLDPVALPGRARAARRRRHGGAGDRLQPGLVLHVVDAAVHRAGRPRDADDRRPRRSGRRRPAARAALRRDDVGRLAVGARADFAVLAAPSYLHLAYRPGVPLVAATYQRAARLSQCDRLSARPAPCPRPVVAVGLVAALRRQRRRLDAQHASPASPAATSSSGRTG